MSKRTRTLRAENEQLAENLSKNGKEVLDDMLLYIRGFDIGIYEQEKVRRDITQMLLDGEMRGEQASDVIGGDYREFCDSVLEEIPRLTAGEKVMMFFRDVCGGISTVSLVFGFFYVVFAVCYIGSGKAAPGYVDVGVGGLLGYLLIAAAGTWITGLYHRNPYKSRRKEYARILLSVGLMLVIVRLARSVLGHVMFTFHAALLLPLAAVLFVIYKALDCRVG